MHASGWRSILLVAGLVAAAGCNAVLGPSKPDANWHIVDTARFSLHVRPGSFAEENVAAIGAILEDQYDATLVALDVRYSARITAMLYESGRDGNLPSDHSGTAYPATNAFEASCAPPYDANLSSLLSHEANHVIIQNTLGIPGTYMLSEGLASAVLSERTYTQGRRFYYAWTRYHLSELPPISRLADDVEWNKVPDDVAYSTSASFLAYLLETAGPARLKQIYLVRSGNFEHRFEEIYGRPLSAVEADWLVFCNRR